MTPETIRELIIGFALPVVVLIVLAALLVTGVDGEVKTLMAAVIGWIVKSGISYKKK